MVGCFSPRRVVVWVAAGFLFCSAANAADSGPPTPTAAPVTAPAAKPESGIRWIYLVRHGIYDRDPKADDEVGNGLNALGHEQAKFTGQRLAALPVKMDLLVSSTLTRARETADDIAQALALPVVRDSLLSECTPGTLRPDIVRDHKPEEFARCEARLEQAWDKYFTPSPARDQRDVLVCHGNVIRWLACKALGVDPRQWTSMDLGNGSITVIAVKSDGSTRLVTFSDTGHLPVEKQTWSGRGAGWAPSP